MGKPVDLKLIATAVSAADDKVIFWIKDFATLRDNRVHDEFEKLAPKTVPLLDKDGKPLLDKDGKPRIGWDNYEATFSLIESRVVEIEFASKEIPKSLVGLMLYWKARNGSLADNWEVFQNTVNSDAIDAFADAWSNRAQGAMEAPKEVQTENPTDPEA